MAGVKGKSGGARPNTGGVRPGAGRKPKPPQKLSVGAHDDPEAFLRAAMNDGSLDARLRIDAAKGLMPYTHAKLGEGGKKTERQKAAHAAGRGKFAPAAAPRLVVNNK